MPVTPPAPLTSAPQTSASQTSVPLTYCTNIHPGEAWADVQRNLHGHALAVKRACAPSHSFPLGLRLSARAAFELDDAEIRRFGGWCEQQGCHVLTLNGFPYGTFHGAPVKASVYQPDWRHPARVAYTRRLADVLAQWTPRTGRSSISTVPVAFKPGFEEAHWPVVRAHLVEALTHLRRLHDAGGPHLTLALEPEPHCVLETTAEVLQCVERLRLPPALADHLGLCLDCCHQAVQFEAPAQCLAQLADASIRIAKVQVSSALRASGRQLHQLLRFDEPTYLHQAVLRTRAGVLRRFADLPALRQWLHGLPGLLQPHDPHDPVDECRVHFHVPIFLEHLGEVGTTRGFLEDLLPRLPAGTPLEVETYSFDALPPEWRLDSLDASIARELHWVQECLDASHRRH